MYFFIKCNYYYQCWKQLFYIFVDIYIYILFIIFWWIENSKELHLFEIEIFCNFINMCIVTFDQLGLNASLLNKLIHFYKKVQTPNY